MGGASGGVKWEGLVGMSMGRGRRNTYAGFTEDVGGYVVFC